MAKVFRSRTKVKRVKPIFDTQEPKLGPLLASMIAEAKGRNWKYER